ncbi:MAG: LON peptidase substrate-binding domain-containing protein [Proteobacteria bacterium]|nr:LON peptidase substrate-binding domain-containing protein [Pseudomonadota bacterium]
MNDAEPTPLPAVIPLFPLSGALLLPHGSLPLHVFEPRYVAMLNDASATDRVIGMIQPADPGDPSENPALYRVGCVGRITQESETSDGKRYFTLTGVSRFLLGEELPLHMGYRRSTVQYDRFAEDQGPQGKYEVETAPLLNAVQIYFGARGFAADWEAVRKMPGEALVNLLAMMCPFAPAEKQSLLEAETLIDRAQVLAALLSLDSQTHQTAALVQ